MYTINQLTDYIIVILKNVSEEKNFYLDCVKEWQRENVSTSFYNFKEIYELLPHLKKQSNFKALVISNAYIPCSDILSLCSSVKKYGINIPTIVFGDILPIMDPTIITQVSEKWNFEELSHNVQRYIRDLSKLPPPTHGSTNASNYLPHGSICFYHKGEPYYEFTNFYESPITMHGKTWPTVEHYFQACKFEDNGHQEIIRSQPTARAAFETARKQLDQFKRKDWESVKLGIMRRAVYEKFNQHPALKNILLATNDALLIEHTTNDKFWGDNGDGTGANNLGLILMDVRKDLRNKL